MFAEARALKVEGGHPQTESMNEDHGQWGVERAGFAHRQRDSVGRGHHIATVIVESLEFLVCIGIFAGVGARHQRSAGRSPDDRGDRDQPGASRKPGPAPQKPAGLFTAQRFRPRDKCE